MTLWAFRNRLLLLLLLIAFVGCSSQPTWMEVTVDPHAQAILLRCPAGKHLGYEPQMDGSLLVSCRALPAQESSSPKP